MTASLWRLLSLPLIVVAFLLVGAPEFPALERAVTRALALPAACCEPPAAAVTLPPATVEPASSEHSRRGALVPLYLSYAALQALDVHSTLRALDSAGIERNPVMRGAAGHPAALIAVKASLAASTIYLVEKVRKKHRRAAVLLMAALNSVYATVVAHNYRTVTP